MIVPLTVRYTDGTTETVDTSALSIVNTERRFNGTGVIELFLGGNRRMEALYWLGYESLRVSGRPVGDFEEWLTKLAEVTTDDVTPLPPPPPE